MADVTGTVHHQYGGKEYTLRLTFGVLAKLQAKHGDDLNGMLTGGRSKAPSFGIMLDAVSGALAKGGTTGDLEVLADDMLSADPDLFARLMAAAFPDAVGNDKAPGKG